MGFPLTDEIKTMTTLNDQIANLKVIPVIALNKLEDALPLG